jgi:hypothetical protein
MPPNSRHAEFASASERLSKLLDVIVSLPGALEDPRAKNQ